MRESTHGSRVGPRSRRGLVGVGPARAADSNYSRPGFPSHVGVEHCGWSGLDPFLQKHFHMVLEVMMPYYRQYGNLQN